MEIKKAQWATDGDNVRLSMPLSKVDVENRLVSGWASLDNADSQGDVVLKEANAKAFSRFRGNIREMHQPIAVGRMVDFREDSYFDQETQKFYNGIFVTVYVSKGAQDTWEKVLDGTLQGFSIGGSILDSETQWVKDANATIRFVKDYELIELSLVDSPANQLANVFSITKSSDGVVMKGMVADTRSENVFWCEDDGIAKTSSDEAVSCGNCGSAMQNIGWFEYDGGDTTEKVAAIVANRNSTSSTSGSQEPIAKQAEPANNEGGVIVAEENKTNEAEVDAGSTAPVTDEVSEEGKAESEVESSNETVVENAEVEETVEEQPAETEKATDNSEVQVDEPDFAKMFGDLQSAIESGLEKNAKQADEAITKASELFENKVNELVAKHTELTDKFESLKKDLGGVEKRLEGVEGETAIKKSGDLGGSTEDTLSKSKGSKWGGRFLGLSDLQ